MNLKWDYSGHCITSVFTVSLGERKIVARTMKSSDNDTLDKILRTTKWLNSKLRVEEHLLFFFSPITFQ